MMRCAAAALARAAAVAAGLLAPAGMAMAEPTGVAATTPETAQPRIVAVASRHAADAALRMLAAGGSAVDALVAAQLVLTVVEPQSSGLGGGALLMLWDPSARRVAALDGLARAPADVPPALQTDRSGADLAPDDRRMVARSGRAIGVPGALALLHRAHALHGKLPWAALFEPAIALAADGFVMPPYMHRTLASPDVARAGADIRALFFGADGNLPAAGSPVRNPQLAALLRRLAAEGPDAFHRGDIAARIAGRARQEPLAGGMTAADLAAYTVVAREPVCAPYRGRTVCAMSPPSFGGVAVLQILGILERGAARADFSDAGFVHRYAEASRLADIDRRAWIGDPDHVPVPTAQMVGPQYLADRAALVDPRRRIERTMPGSPAGAERGAFERTCTPPPPSTSQVAIVDGAGLAVSMTTTVNLNWGSYAAVDGLVLNNAMTNFSRAGGPGVAAPNAMAPGKRPVTSMAPLFVFDAAGDLEIAGGSAGGGEIVGYIAKSLVEMIDNGRTPQQALDAPNVAVICDTVQLEPAADVHGLRGALEAVGHRVVVRPLVSGQHFVRRSGAGWIGGADPRRDGVVRGF